jgi:hypothetical protein
VGVGVGVDVGVGVGVDVGVGVGVDVGVGVGVGVGVEGWVTRAVMLTHWEVKAPKVGTIMRIPRTMVMTVPSSVFEGLRRCAAIPLIKLATLERRSAPILRHPNAAKLAATVTATSTVTTPASTRHIARLRAPLSVTLCSTKTARMSIACDFKVAKPARPIATTSTTAIAMRIRRISGCRLQSSSIA